MDCKGKLSGHGQRGHSRRAFGRVAGRDLPITRFLGVASGRTRLRRGLDGRGGADMTALDLKSEPPKMAMRLRCSRGRLALKGGAWGWDLGVCGVGVAGAATCVPTSPKLEIPLPEIPIQ